MKTMHQLTESPELICVCVSQVQNILHLKLKQLDIRLKDASYWETIETEENFDG